MSSFERDAVWSNSDGLRVGFGTRSEQTNSLAKANTSGAVETARMTIDYSGLEDTDSVTAASFSEHSVRIPRGSLIHRATLQVVTGFDSAGDTATLDIGTYDADYSTVTVDVADGIDVDIAEAAIDTIGEIVACNGSLVGGIVAVGTTSDSDVVIIPAYQTEAFTSGRGVLTIEYSTPADGSYSLAV